MSATIPAGTLRVRQVVQEFSLRGGIESVAYELHRAWQAEPSVSSRVFASSNPNRIAGVEPVAPFLARIGTRGALRHVGRAAVVPAFTLMAQRPIRAAMGRAPRELVLSHGDTLAGDICVVHAVNRANIDAKRRDGDWRWMLNPMHHWVSARDRWMIGGLRFRRYVALSRRIADELVGYYRVPCERICIIPNGVNPVRFSPAPQDRFQTRRDFGIGQDVPLLAFVGHEFDRKGLVLAIDAVARLPAPVSLLVVGAGNRRPFEAQAAGQGIADRVVFTGARDDVPKLLRAADAFLLPTAYEAFCLSIMEAMACGLPAFATRVGGPDEYLQPGANGFFVERDGAVIAATVAPVLADPALHARLSRGARETAAAHSWTAIANRYADLLRSVASELNEAAHAAQPAAIRRGMGDAVMSMNGGAQ